MSNRGVTERMFGNSFSSRSFSSEFLEDRNCRCMIQVNDQEGVLKTWAPGDYDYMISVFEGVGGEKEVVGNRGRAELYPSRAKWPVCPGPSLRNPGDRGLCQPPGFAG